MEASGALSRYFNVLFDEITINGFRSANSIIHFVLFPSVHLYYLPKLPVSHDGRSTYGTHTVYSLILDVAFFSPPVTDVSARLLGLLV